MADIRKGGSGFGIPTLDDDFDDDVIEGVASTDSSLAGKRSDLKEIRPEKNAYATNNDIKSSPNTPTSPCILPNHNDDMLVDTIMQVEGSHAPSRTQLPGDNNPKSVLPDPPPKHNCNAPLKSGKATETLTESKHEERSGIAAEKTYESRLSRTDTTQSDSSQITEVNGSQVSAQPKRNLDKKKNSPVVMGEQTGGKMMKESRPNQDNSHSLANKPASVERKLGAGFGVPAPNEDEPNMVSPSEISFQHPVDSNVRDIREGNGGFGIPRPVLQNHSTTDQDANPDEIIPKEGDKYPFQRKKEMQKAADIEKEFEAISLQSTFITGIQKIYLLLLVFLASFLGFYTITQTTNFIVQLKDCPAIVKYPLYVAVSAFALVLFYFIYKIVRSWFALKRSPQVSLGMLSTLSKRRDLQEKCYKKADEACDELYGILHGIREEEYNKSLKSMRFSDGEISELSASRMELCKRHEERMAGRGRESSPEWIDAFAENYQTKLDYFASERIKYYSYHGGIAATISHIPAMDRFIVLSAMFGLVKDLLEIYNIRPSRINTSILLSKIIINTFCAGYVQEGAEAYGEGVNKALEVFRVSFTSIPIVKDFMQASISLGVEATAHAFLINRVGVAAQKMLFPIVKK